MPKCFLWPTAVSCLQGSLQPMLLGAAFWALPVPATGAFHYFFLFFRASCPLGPRSVSPGGSGGPNATTRAGFVLLQGSKYALLVVWRSRLCRILYSYTHRYALRPVVWKSSSDGVRIYMSTLANLEVYTVTIATVLACGQKHGMSIPFSNLHALEVYTVCRVAKARNVYNYLICKSQKCV